MRAHYASCKPLARNVAAVALALVASAPLTYGGVSLVLPVAEDESVLSFAPDKNYDGNLNRGGLFVGADGTGTGVSRFYLKFNVPEFVEPDDVQSATLWATYLDDLDRSDNGLHRIHFVGADDWSEDAITWDNQPGPSFGTPEATFDSGASKPGDLLTFDVGNIVREQLKLGDRVISFMFSAANESAGRDNRNWEYFAEREFDPNRAFHLTLATAGRVGGGNGGGPIAVPLPPAAWPAAITLAGAGAVALRRRLRRRG